MRTWPADWEARKRGEQCPMCADARVDENPFGIRFFAGAVSDAYLGWTGAARGYAYVIWRGRHVAEPTELTDDEATRFGREMLVAARAIEAHYTPAKMNYQALGNAVPHLHVHLVPRYVDDPAPNRPLSSDVFDHPPWTPTEASVREDAAALRTLIGRG
jgi:diadenosine tetraphosphate (Ap4A) HIT family hydrolase